MASHSSILAWKSHGQRNLAGCKELDTTEYAHMLAAAVRFGQMSGWGHSLPYNRLLGYYN